MVKKTQEFEFIGYTLHNVRRNEIAFHANIYVYVHKKISCIRKRNENLEQILKGKFKKYILNSYVINERIGWLF